MASYNELQFEWSMLCSKEQEQWNYSDLQLAAELGKTLLERNKELECSLKKHQHLIEDQAQEIEYLTKQNAALREINDSRLRIYETLDVGIQDLELERNRLLVETAADKKLIKNLNQTIESLESRCDELTKQVEDMSKYLSIEKRKNERLNESLNDSFLQKKTFRLDKPVKEVKDEGNASEPENDEATTPTNSSKPFDGGQNIEFNEKNSSSTHSHDTTDSGFNNSNSGQMDNEEIIKLMSMIEEAKRQYINEHNRVAELEEQLSMIAQDNQKLQSRLAKMDTIDEMKSVHEELSILEEVRQGQMCCCLRNLEDRLVPTENTSMIGTDMDEDDRSLMDLLNSTETGSKQQIYRSAVTIKFLG